MADPYLTQLGAGLGFLSPPGPGDAYAQAVGAKLFPPAPAPPPAAPPPEYNPATMGPITGVAGVQGPAPLAPAAPPPAAPPPPPGPNMSVAPSMVSEENMSRMPAPPAPVPEAAPAPMGVLVPGARAGAREVNVYGPTQWKALGAANDAFAESSNAVAQRQGQFAVDAEAVAYDQERRAQARYDAIQAAEADHAEELRQRHEDFDATVKQLGEIQQSQSKTSKQANDAGMLLGIFGGLVGMLGGPKAAYMVGPVLGVMQKRIDQNVAAQEFAYRAGVDKAKNQQTSFSMAMEKYQNIDAARAAARGASLDIAQAQLQRMRAKETNVNAQNALDKAIADLAAQKAEQIGHGLRYVQAQASGPKYVVNVGGAPVVMDAKQYVEHIKNGGEMALKVRGQDIEAGKAGAQHQGRFVRMPNGNVIDAGDETAARSLRTKVQAAEAITQKANEAIALRQKVFTPGAAISPIETTKNMQRLRSLQAQITIEAKNAAELGALSGPDMDLVMGATGSLLSPSPGVDEQLRSFSANSRQGVQRFVDTIPGASGQTGYATQMPSSFKPAGK